MKPPRSVIGHTNLIPDGFGRRMFFLIAGWWHMKARTAEQSSMSSMCRGQRAVTSALHRFANMLQSVITCRHLW